MLTQKRLKCHQTLSLLWVGSEHETNHMIQVIDMDTLLLWEMKCPVFRGVLVDECVMGMFTIISLILSLSLTGVREGQVAAVPGESSEVK